MARQPALSAKRKRELARRAVAVVESRDKLHAAIREAHKEGATIRAIAAAVELSPARVHAIVKEDN